MTTSAAGEVAAAILGPTYYRRLQGRRSLEAAVASWVIAILEDEGHEIVDLWSPDTDRSRLPERKDARPELAMTMDGQPAALDVTMFTTNDAGAARGRGKRVQRAVAHRLEGLDDDRSALAVVVYDPDRLTALSVRAAAEAAAALATAYEAAVRTTSGQVDRQDLRPEGPWIRGCSLTLTEVRDGRRRVAVYVTSRRGDVVAYVDRFIAEAMAKKVRQLAPWGRGILVVVHGFGFSAQDVRAGFERLDRCPWWRVYWAGPSPELVELVAAEEVSP